MVSKIELGEMPLELISEITKIYYDVHNRTHDWHSFENSLKIFLAVLGSWKNEEEYMEAIKGLDKETLSNYAKIFGLLLKHFAYEEKFADVLGPVYQNLSRNHKGLGQFFTPWHIAFAMAQMSGTTGKKMIDPCCGSGVMILAAKAAIVSEKGRGALQECEFFGTDIDSVCIDMCRIQGILTDDRFMRDFLLIKGSEMLKKIAESKGQVAECTLTE